MSRLKNHNVPFQGPIARFNEQVLSFSDPDGLQLELVATQNSKLDRVWKDGPVPADYGLGGFHSVALSEASLERTSSLLTDTMGFRRVGQIGNRHRFEVGAGGAGATVDILTELGAPRGMVSVGTVHHVAWRTPEDEQQKAWRQQLIEAGMNVTPIIDRKYFHSIYYREPGGVLFEIATDPPGFAVDEPIQDLGGRLMLPPLLEPHRSELERVLPPLTLPNALKAR
jgi:glyoxalase family protein